MKVRPDGRVSLKSSQVQSPPVIEICGSITYLSLFVLLLIHLQQGLDRKKTNFAKFGYQLSIWFLVQYQCSILWRPSSYTGILLILLACWHIHEVLWWFFMPLILQTSKEWCMLVFISNDDHIELDSVADKLMHATIFAVGSSQLIVKKRMQKDENYQYRAQMPLEHDTELHAVMSFSDISISPLLMWSFPAIKIKSIYWSHTVQFETLTHLSFGSVEGKAFVVVVTNNTGC